MSINEKIRIRSGKQCFKPPMFHRKYPESSMCFSAVSEGLSPSSTDTTDTVDLTVVQIVHIWHHQMMSCTNNPVLVANVTDECIHLTAEAASLFCAIEEKERKNNTWIMFDEYPFKAKTNLAWLSLLVSSFLFDYHQSLTFLSLTFHWKHFTLAMTCSQTSVHQHWRYCQLYVPTTITHSVLSFC